MLPFLVLYSRQDAPLKQGILSTFHATAKDELDEIA